MDSILHYTSVSHAGSLMQGVNKMRVSSDFSDVTVVVGDFRILAHRIILSASSPFFYQMLKFDTRSETSKCNEIFLDNIDEIAALKIIEFCYTSAISLDDNIVWPLLEAAIKFQLQEICSLCCEFLTAGLDVSNCVLSLRLAARLRFPQLEENCIRFLVDNLQKACASPDLISLSPQELSTVLSMLEIHGNDFHVIATLTQAWLNWDRKSRVDFVPMLKVLLPRLGDHFQRFLDGAQSGLDQGNTGGGNNVGEAKSKVSLTSSLPAKSRSPDTRFQNNAVNISSVDINSKDKDSSTDLPVSSSDLENKAASVKGKDFICISCGDEFESKDDLSAHGRLCDESVNIVKSVGEKSIAPLPTGFDPIKESNVETAPSDCQDKTNESISQSENFVNISKSSDSKNDSTGHNNSISVEQPYPKLRRSPRGHKPDFKLDDYGDRKSSLHSNVNSQCAVGESNTDNDNKSLFKSVDKIANNEEQASSKLDKHETQMTEGEFQEESIKEIPQNDGDKSFENSHSVNALEGVTRESSNTDDNNNNDSIVQCSADGIQAKDSFSKKNDNDSSIQDIVPTGEVDKGIITQSSPKEETMSSKEEERVENKGSSTLKQWREEHQNSAPVNSLINSTPKHKCLICSRGFWDRKALTNHWRQDHGVQSSTLEEEENSSSDHEIKHPTSKGSKRKCLSPKNAYSPSPNIKPVSNNASDVKSDHHLTVQGNGHGRSFNHDTNNGLHRDHLTGQAEKSVPGSLKIKEEMYERKVNAVPMEAFGNYKNYSKNVSTSQQTSSEVEQSQAALKQPPFENVNSEQGNPLRPPAENQMREHNLWPQGNTDRGLNSSPMGKASQNVSQTANEFFTSYVNHYSKLAEWCMTQGAHYCPLCLVYHPAGKPCPKVVPQNGSSSGSKEHGKGEYSVKDKDSKETPTKKDGEEEGPLDMSKSSLDFSGGHLTPSSSSSSSKSSSMNSSGLSVPPFFNYGMSESDVLDMSKARFGDGKMVGHQPGDLPLSLRKSPVDPNTSFANSFLTYPLQFSTAPPLQSLNAGPSSSTPNTSNSLSSVPKSSNVPKKKVTSRQGFPCTVCNRVFSYQTALFTHMHTHSPSARSYRCQLCNETFARAPDLKVHVCPNGLEKPYSCPSCGQTFAKNIHLKRHLATHSGLKPYPCWVCGKRFSRSDHLKRHTQSIHAGARPHVCQVCGKEFVRKYELNKHMQSHEQTFSSEQTFAKS